MRIDGLGPIQQPDPKGKKGEDVKKKGDSRPDTVELSNKATEQGKAGYTEDVIRGKANQSAPTQDIREIKQRSSQGYYDTPTVRQSTSDKLIDSKELNDVVNKYHHSKLANEIQSKPVEVRQEKVTAVKKKVAEGFYNDAKNYGSFADKIIRHFRL